MLNYAVQYNVSYGIFLTFKNNLPKRSFSVNHKKDKVDKMKILFPYQKYETYTRENFIAACLYIMYTFNPSSFNKMLDYLRNIDYNNIIKFKNDIINYQINLQQDITFLREKYCNPTLKDILQELKDNKIKFYTFYFYIRVKEINIDTIIDNSRVLGSFVQRIKQLLLFITFKEEAINKIVVLFEESNILKGMN